MTMKIFDCTCNLSQLAFVLLFGISSSCFPRSSLAKPFEKIKVQDSWLVDTEGRVRLFHGFNAVSKGPPWYPSNLLNDTQLKYLREWGMNVVRLGTMWSGVYPEKDQRNDTYLGIMGEIVDKLGDYGMYALLDMHQDGLSSHYGTYDGAPKWLIERFPKPRLRFPWPFKKIGFWPETYITDATGEGFQNLYHNTSNALGYLSQFWQTVVKSLGRTKDNVIGYELINEPWAGDIWLHPSLILPGYAGSENLQPLYDFLAKEIRKLDNSTLIFYEPVTWGVLLNGKHVGTGFSHVPGGDTYRDRSVLAYHYYCWILQIVKTDPHKHYPYVERTVCDKILGPGVFKAIKSDLKSNGGSSFLTEFGVCAPDGKTNSTGTIECDFVLNQADDNLQSWTYWDSVFFDSNGSVIWPTVRSFARSYARAVAGIPVRMSFNITTADFVLWYNLDGSIKAATEIFLPSLHYPNGFLVSLSKGLEWTWDSVNNILSVRKKTALFFDPEPETNALAKVFVTKK